MKPRTIRFCIFIILWVAYFGTDFISLASKKIVAKNLSSLVVAANRYDELKAANENYMKFLLGASKGAGSVADTLKEIERIYYIQAAYRYATLSVWFYLCAWAIFKFHNRVRINA